MSCTSFQMKFLILSLLFTLKSILAQSLHVVSVSPSFNEIANNENPEILIEFNTPVEPASFNNISFSVFGERTAYHNGQLKFTNENKTVSFISQNIFNAGERVTVSLSKGILSVEEDSLRGFSWTFRIPVKPKPLNFSEPVNYGGGGYGMQCIDMNNDGYPDIVTSSGIIWINDGNGEFSTYWYLDDTDGFYPIIADDFNKDGFMDILYTGAGGLTLGLGNGAGNFNKSYYPWWFRDYISADINFDGYPDLIGVNVFNTPNDTASYFAITLNDGAGQYNDTVVSGILRGWIQKVIVSDVDNNGASDILIISHLEPINVSGLDGLAVFRNNGEGVFNEYQLYPASLYFDISAPNYLYTSDFNNDRLLDIGVLGDFGGAITLNKGNGFFGTETDTANLREFWGAELKATFTGGDLNGDSWIDIAVSGFGFPFDPQWPKQYIVLSNCGSYFLNCNSFFDTLGNYTALIYANAAVDLNGNGFLDLVHSGNGVYITYSLDITPSVDDNSELQNGFILYQNYPNPFNSHTEINFVINKKEKVHIIIYNILGEEVRFLENKEFLPGRNRVVWDGKDNNGANLPSGAYLIRANFSDLYKTIKSIILK
jgi:hypothetical protein